MKQVITKAFGGVENLVIEEVPTPTPEPGQALVRLTSIGMNYAELMGRQGMYKLSTGDPPFVLGLEGGGIVESIGEGVTDIAVGQRVVLSPKAPRPAAGGMGGTYRSHYLLPARELYPAPDALKDQELGALWLAYLTAWGCLMWKHGGIKPGMVVGLPAASSSVALAASQIVKQHGGTTIGLTTSPGKVEQIKAMPEAMYDHLVITHDKAEDGTRTMRKWRNDIKQITDGKGVDVYFDPVAAGEYLFAEILSVAQNGAIYVYGLLGEPGVVDVTPLIRKRAAIHGWVNNQIIDDPEACDVACRAILHAFADGHYKLPIGGTFALDDVAKAHTEMAKGQHVGKLVLMP